MADLKTLLFDLDGTLVRTREASWQLFRQTNEKFGLGVDTPSAFYGLFDRNFYTALDEAAALNGNARGEEVREHLQGLLSTSYTPDLVPGMASVVRALAAHYTLVVLSSNTMEAVRRILQANNIAHCFAHVFSGDLAPNKHDAIRRFLADPSYSSGRRCSPNYEEDIPPRLQQPHEAMLITDTVGDVEEALRAGIRVAAVIWGMHSAEDLERAGAEFVCIWPEELVAYLRPGEACSTGMCTMPSAVTSVESPAASSPQAWPVQTGPSLPSAARRARRAEAAARTGERLGASTVQDPPSDCECAGCAMHAVESRETSGAPPVDPLLRRVLALLAQPSRKLSILDSAKG